MEMFENLKNISGKETIVRVGSLGKIYEGYLHIIVELSNTHTIHFSISLYHFTDLFEILKLKKEELPVLLVHDNMLIRELAKYNMDRLI
jgi:hypothetical protein